MCIFMFQTILDERGFPMPNPVRVLIADDHSVVRAGLRSLLEHHTNFNVVGEASNGEEAVAKAVELKPDVAVLDIRMPGLSGIEACKQISKKLKAAAWSC